jgi:hypothetical protein
MKTHEYTSEQIQTAIDVAYRLSAACKLSLCSSTKDWKEEKAQRLSIARAFLAALSKLTTPWTLPAPPPGRKWHREDWTQDMLPEGWRPLLELEKVEIGDEVWLNKEYKWHVSKNGSDMARNRHHPYSRTRRPLPAQVNAEPEQIKPADEPNQKEKWRAEFEELFFPVKPRQFRDGSYVNYEPLIMWRAFLAAKKGGVK